MDRRCAVCKSRISENVWDSFQGMCVKCENESYDVRGVK